VPCFPPLGIIEFIHATSIGVSISCWRGDFEHHPQQELETVDHLEKRPRLIKEKIAFDDDDLRGTT